MDTSYIPCPDEFLVVDKDAVPTNLDEVKTAIGYPTEAKEKGIVGTVIVRVLVDPRGNGACWVVMMNPNRILTDAVWLQIPNLKFQPAVRNDARIWQWISLGFKFALEN